MNATVFRKSAVRPAITVLAATILVTLAVLRWVPRPTNAYFWLEIFNWGHIWLFAAVTLLSTWSLGRLFPALSFGRVLALAALACFTLAGISELLQIGAAGRNADPKDLGRDTAGIVLAIACMYAWHAQKEGTAAMRRIGMLSIATSVALVTVASGPLVKMFYDYRERETALPTLFSPDLRWSRSFVRNVLSELSYGEPPPGFADFSGRYCLHVRTSERLFSGAEFPDLYADWNGYRRLVLELYSSDMRRVPLMVRLDGSDSPYRTEDWAVVRIDLKHGSNRIDIDLDSLRNSGTGKRFDRSNIYNIFVIARDEGRRRDFCIGDIELLR